VKGKSGIILRCRSAYGGCALKLQAKIIDTQTFPERGWASRSSKSGPSTNSIKTASLKIGTGFWGTGEKGKTEWTGFSHKKDPESTAESRQPTAW